MTGIRFIVLLSLFMVVGWGASSQAQELEGNDTLAFMIGEWAITSSFNLEAYLSQAPAPDAPLQNSEGVAHIVSLMEDSALLERYVSVVDEQLYEQTFFLGTRNDGQAWDAASTDNRLNQLLNLRGTFENERLDLTSRGGGRSDPHWQITLEQTGEDAFDWRLSLVMPDETSILVWEKHYTRLGNTTFDEQAAQTRSDYPSPPAPEHMSDFHFWLGTWQIDHPRFDDVIDRIELASGGHAMIEFWQVQNRDNPPQFFTMTIWDEEHNWYHNWLWARLASTQEFTGGRCEGEGAEKRCRLAGVFSNITEDRIEWRYNGSMWVFNRLAFPEN